jgi:hypothetical protein
MMLVHCNFKLDLAWVFKCLFMLYCRRAMRKLTMWDRVQNALRSLGPSTSSSLRSGSKGSYMVMVIDMGVHGLDSLSEPLTLTQVCT